MRRAHNAIELQDWRPSADVLGWLGAALALVVAPHVPRLPIWVTLAFVGFAGWRWLGLRRGLWTPGPWLTALLAGIIVLAVALEYRTVLGRDAGVALLTVLAAMKLLETRSPRDAYVAVFLAFFLIITNFLFSQSIATGVYMVMATLVTVAAMVAIGQPDGEPGGRARLRLAGILLLQALPLMLVLFVLFPRLPGPLWGLPADAHAGRSGLSDSMSPGDISELGLSSAVAFRVKFDGSPPPAAEMYWRGPVLEVSDGRRWSRVAGGTGGAPTLSGEGRTLDYEVTLEATRNRWLLALDMPVEVGLRASINTLGEVRVSRPLRERVRYRARSALDVQLHPGSQAELQRALALVAGAHPAARGLAGTWRSRHGDDDGAVVQAALTHFRDGGFVYTLRPPLLQGDPIDEFLFDTRRGFCEHYAAAFTVLMRAAGIPARVVTGYQGGEWNELGGYWIVRQRDAHAWSEVWLGERGWVRVDPTAAVSPNRIEQGLDVAIPESASEALLGIAPGGTASRLWRHARLGWDALNDGWNQWVLGYGADRQRRLLERLGVDARDWRQMGLMLAAGTVLAVLLTLAWLWRRRERVDPVVRQFGAFCNRLARLGVSREPWEGPLDYGERAARALPALAQDIRHVAMLYARARYAADGTAARQLRDAVRRLRAR